MLACSFESHGFSGYPCCVAQALRVLLHCVGHQCLHGTEQSRRGIVLISPQQDAVASGALAICRIVEGASWRWCPCHTTTRTHKTRHEIPRRECGDAYHWRLVAVKSISLGNERSQHNRGSPCSRGLSKPGEWLEIYHRLDYA